jgi:hypothetical protein
VWSRWLNDDIRGGGGAPVVGGGAASTNQARGEGGVQTTGVSSEVPLSKTGWMRQRWLRFRQRWQGSGRLSRTNSDGGGGG